MSDASAHHDPEGTKKPDGLGGEGTIPNEPDGVGVGAGEPTTFEPEEDPDAASQRDPDAPGPGPDDTDPDTNGSDGPDAAEGVAF
ncbi:hypothetical protein [Agromyces humi]|uniref:hypothetical protein n=1 Tax=Agromyces humi TaxID=1766800 RepID=UPI001358E7F8|nr:hypothetical protein [Agromyces humi]